MMLNLLKYHYCKRRMVAFVNGDLPAPARRRVARYIDENQAIYRDYIATRRITQELQTRIPAANRPTDVQLNRIWDGIQADLRPAPRGWMPQKVFRPGYALAMLATVMAIALPLLLGENSISLAADTTLPEPGYRVTLATTIAPDDSLHIAAATAEPMFTDSPTDNTILQATPRPVLEPGENATRTYGNDN